MAARFARNSVAGRRRNSPEIPVASVEKVIVFSFVVDDVERLRMRRMCIVCVLEFRYWWTIRISNAACNEAPARCMILWYCAAVGLCVYA